MKPLPKKPSDEFSDKLGRADNGGLVRHKKEQEKKDHAMQDLLKQPGGKQSLMDFIFGKTKENPLNPPKDTISGK